MIIPCTFCVSQNLCFFFFVTQKETFQVLLLFCRKFGAEKHKKHLQREHKLNFQIQQMSLFICTESNIEIDPSIVQVPGTIPVFGTNQKHNC